ncbi:MAG TPA: sigma-70 family RNA polymerase sigma factor [Ignavibacteria bacterium]|nr:sigma-70 family RNA polymerase sigma factor [Ignavibacteria bacterium]
MSKYVELTDLELMQRISKYDSRALEELFERYSDLLYTLVKKIAPDELTAENILVEIFAIIWKNIEKFDFETGNVYTWIVTLARNRAVESLRRSRDSSSTLDFYDDDFENLYIIPYLSRDIDTLDIKTAFKVKDKVEKALARLTDAQKYVIHLAYYDGYTLDEIADKLNIPVETVRTKVLTAMHSLRENLLQGQS